jgi:predicted phosphodiesterase
MKMKRRYFLQLLLTILVGSVFLSCSTTSDKELSFVISSDQRDHAAEQFRTKEYTLPGYEAIKKVGQGSFMVVLGDIDPPQATRDLMDKVFGKDYPWYVVRGNHDKDDASMEYLRSLNRGDKSYPHLVRKGPAGCEETTYSFDWNEVHFVVLNVFYDGKTDNAKEANVVPGLLAWLEDDLKQNKEQHIFVFGHKPLFSVLDMDNGTQRHNGEVLDMYPDNSLKFQRLLLKYHVVAYVSGHTHCASYASINGLWLLNDGHIYGYEDTYTPELLFARISKEIERGQGAGIDQSEAIANFFESDKDEVKKIIFVLDPIPGKEDDDLTDAQALKGLKEFYNNYKKSDAAAKEYSEKFWDNCGWRPSTFLKVKISGGTGVVEFYRDKDFTGNYTLRHSQILFSK